ncbi:MAG: hypothetical protein OEM43_09485, partial [Gammaproteobacteria bacterium]|nr:hypothetical protein [Gammaproteobacteria bacterium]
MQAAVLVFLAAPAGAGIVATDLPAFANEGRIGLSALSKKILKEPLNAGFYQSLLFQDFGFAHGLESCETFFRCKQPDRLKAFCSHRGLIGIQYIPQPDAAQEAGT